MYLNLSYAFAGCSWSIDFFREFSEKFKFYRPVLLMCQYWCRKCVEYHLCRLWRGKDFDSSHKFSNNENFPVVNVYKQRFRFLFCDGILSVWSLKGKEREILKNEQTATGRYIATRITISLYEKSVVFFRQLQTFRNLGESDDNRSATAYTVYLDLLECEFEGNVALLLVVPISPSISLVGQILVDHFFDPDIQSIYFKQQLTDNKIDYILPVTGNENIDLLRLHRICRKLCSHDDSKGLVVAVVGANGAVIYQRFGDGKVLDFRIQNWGMCVMREGPNVCELICKTLQLKVRSNKIWWKRNFFVCKDFTYWKIGAKTRQNFIFGNWVL